MRTRITMRWRHFWLSRGGYGQWGRRATWLGSLGAGSHRQLHSLPSVAPDRGFIAPSARISGVDLRQGTRVFIGERVVIAGCEEVGEALTKSGREPAGKAVVTLADGAQINRESTLELFAGGSITIGEEVGVQMRCHFEAARNPIVIGRRAMIAPYCVFSSGTRHLEPGASGARDCWESNGPVIVGEDAWLGVGVKVMSGVTIGEGAVVAAGSVVTCDIPVNAIAGGNPARVIRSRADLASVVTPDNTIPHYRSAVKAANDRY